MATFVKDIGQSVQYVIVHSPWRVLAVGYLDECMVRPVYATAEMVPLSGQGQYWEQDEFVIWLQERVQKTEARDRLLQIVSNVKEETERTSADDGVSQTVTSQAGIVRLGKVTLLNPVPLQPWRTFSEVAQPESLFVFRMRKGPEFALFEGDGGRWQEEAMKNIREFLREKVGTAADGRKRR
jgi:hypothetical protein